jgi:anti-anti-sigma factor
MQYAFKSNGNTAQLTISGTLTFAQAPLFPKVLAELEAARGVTDLTIILNGLTFIDSTGMSLFVHIYDASQSRNMSVSVQGANGPVAASMDRAAFKTLFEFK